MAKHKRVNQLLKETPPPILTDEELAIVGRIQENVKKTNWVKMNYEAVLYFFKGKWVNWQRVPYGEPQSAMEKKLCGCLVGLVHLEVMADDPNWSATTKGDSEIGVVGDVSRYCGAMSNAKSDQLVDDGSEASKIIRIGWALWHAINKMTPGTTADAIENWNDSPRRSREDVVEVLDLVKKLNPEGFQYPSNPALS